MTRPRSLASLAGCLLAFACASAHAAPSPYSTLIVFGDSLADAGTFADPGGPDGSTYRYTNRTGPGYLPDGQETTAAVSSTLLGGRMGVAPDDLNASTSPVHAANGRPDGNNWAVGGYTTRQIHDAITGESVVTDPATGQVQRTRPGYLLSNGGRADPKALYLLSGGGNDFLGGLVTDAASAAAAGNRLADSVQALQQAGANYLMVWMLPDLGLTPALNGTPLQETFSQLGGVFNQSLLLRLAQIDAQIIPLNVPLLLKKTFADPGRFGLATDQNLNQTCFSGLNCVANPVYGVGGTQPDPSKLLYNDSVHPTETGQHLLADYGYSLLSAPWELTLLPEMALGTLRAHQDQIHSQWQADLLQWQPVGGWRSIVAAGGLRTSFAAQDSSRNARGNSQELTLGASYRIDEAWRVGGVAGLYRQTLHAGPRQSHYALDSYLATAFAQMQKGHWWADTALTGGRLDYDDLQRKFALGVSQGIEKGNTDGWLWASSTRVGYDLAEPGSAWRASPFISADYAKVRVNGHAEKGARSTALTFADQQRDSRRLGLGVQAHHRIAPRTLAFGEVLHEHEFDNDQRTVRMALNTVPDVAFRLQGHTPGSKSNRLNVGVRHQVTDQLALDTTYHLRKDQAVLQQGMNLALNLDL